ncbi:MAG: fused MFS/spermidine synthase [Gemmatimonadaceae bacterium]|nr:fused MFS/spermidine synthase [Gemmatimonadaceae bacterium]
MLVLYAITLFVAGALLFLVQPMFAKMVLPLFGGAPAVWNTAMVFYQVLLLAGYLYAYGVRRWLSARQQVLLHLALLAVPLVALPIGARVSLVPPSGASPVPWLLAMLFAGVGAPFFVVSITSPLLQAWFARTDHPAAAHPYQLYAASNAGSMLALLAYPLLLEPRLGLRQQSGLWSWGYATFAVLAGACALTLLRGRAVVRGDVLAGAVSAGEGGGSATRITSVLRSRWVLLAFVPSSLMLSVTTYMSTNIAPLPLLWVVPLALYLLTFILAFSRQSLLPAATVRGWVPLLVLPLLATVLADMTEPIRLLIALHLVAFAVVAMACHATLADELPAVESLTEFYLWLSVGGALGGVLNALVAPLLFSSLTEYPLVLALAAFLLAGGDDAPEEGILARTRSALAHPTRAVVNDVALPALLVVLVIALDPLVKWMDLGRPAITRLLVLLIPTLLCYLFTERPARLAIAMLGLTSASVIFDRDRHLLVAERSFFGISRVMSTGDAKYHQLVNGSIAHGLQSRVPSRRREPLSYYTERGPIGQLIRDRQAAGRLHRVASVGLGAGSLACFRRPGEEWTFYELDATILRIARDTSLFTFLHDCAPEARVVLGDARLSLREAPDAGYDLIILDAYSADAIPVHLMTREALALYRRKLAPGGVVAMHLSNLFFELGPVAEALARDARMASLWREDVRLSALDLAWGKSASQWIVLGSPATALGGLARDTAWKHLDIPADAPVWTDDFSSTLRALRRR